MGSRELMRLPFSKTGRKKRGLVYIWINLYRKITDFCAKTMLFLVKIRKYPTEKRGSDGRFMMSDEKFRLAVSWKR